MNTKSLIPLFLFISIVTLLINCATANKNRKNPTGKSIGAKTNPNFLIISDLHLHNGKTQVQAACKCGDSGNDLWDAAKKEIAVIIKTNKPSFIIVLGDLPYHADDSLKDINEVRESFYAAYTDLKHISENDQIPLIMAPGNNDSYGGDYHALELNNYNYLPALSLFQANSNACYGDAVNQNLGYYSIYPLGINNKLKVVVLNTVILCRPNKNKYLLYGDNKAADTKAELTWLKNQLDQASINKERVLITMHVPPGTDGYSGNEMWESALIQNQFLDLIHAHQKNIIGLLSSHTHMDGIRLLRDSSQKNITALLISAPAIAPGHGNNPSLKSINYNADYALTNFTTYYMGVGGKTDMVTNWDASFSFKSQTNYHGHKPMLPYFKEQNKNDTLAIKAFVFNIYSAMGNKKINHTETDKTIYVDYRK